MAVKLDVEALAALERAVRPAALQTMDALRGDVISAQVMPFDMGDMQNNGTFTVCREEDGKAVARLVTGSPQARRLYYHPEYSFQRGKNVNAGGGWLEPWLTGENKEFVEHTFAALYKKGAGL